ncbi:MAG: hypothetical protein M3094_10500, partial [Actinomycetia bacterium]|nr:hypothetical protein [Actinomycetes bacterium]
MNGSQRFWFLRPTRGAWLMVLALIVGIGAGAGAAALIYSLRIVSTAVLRLAEITSLDRSLLFLVIPIGIWLAWLITAKWAPEAAGHGVP